VCADQTLSAAIERNGGKIWVRSMAQAANYYVSNSLVSASNEMYLSIAPRFPSFWIHRICPASPPQELVFCVCVCVCLFFAAQQVLAALGLSDVWSINSCINTRIPFCICRFLLYYVVVVFLFLGWEYEEVRAFEFVSEGVFCSMLAGVYRLFRNARLPRTKTSK